MRAARQGLTCSRCITVVAMSFQIPNGCAYPVAGSDPLKRFVQGSCRLPIADRWKRMLGRPARGDLIGENAEAVAALLRTVSPGERHRA
jgi:hypothetical protein